MCGRMDDTSTRYLYRPALVSSPPSLVFFLLFCCRARRGSQTEEVRQGGDGGEAGDEGEVHKKRKERI